MRQVSRQEGGKEERKKQANEWKNKGKKELCIMQSV